jgi:hypothetical protein
MGHWHRRVKRKRRAGYGEAVEIQINAVESCGEQKAKYARNL